MRFVTGPGVDPGLLVDVRLLPQEVVPAEVALQAILDQVGGRYRWTVLRDTRLPAVGISQAPVPKPQAAEPEESGTAPPPVGSRRER